MKLVFSAYPSFASTAGGVAVTVYGSGFLAAVASRDPVRCRFNSLLIGSWYLATRAQVLSATILVCNASRLCDEQVDASSQPAAANTPSGYTSSTSSPQQDVWPFVTSAASYAGGRCSNVLLNASHFQGSLDVALNGQQYTNTNGSVLPFQADVGTRMNEKTSVLHPVLVVTSLHSLPSLMILNFLGMMMACDIFMHVGAFQLLLRVVHRTVRRIRRRR